MTNCDVNVPGVRPPRMMTAVVFLAAFAIMLSWLVVYAAAGTLVSADVLSPWPKDDDPRPRWMLWMFTGMFSLFLLAAAVFGWTGRRQLKGLEEQEAAEM